MKNLGKIFYLFFKFFKKTWPAVLIIIIVFVFFWKVFLLGRVALPADLINLGSYPVKNPITSDAVSFSYPMRKLGVDLIRSGHWPLWNPYILSGTPLLANFQSAPFSPTNIIYLFFDFTDGWNVQVMLQHILAALFTFLLLRHWKISRFGSVLGSIIYAFGGFNLIWSQWNAHALTASFIPLIIFFADRLLKRGGILNGIGVSVVLMLQIFSGYPQIVFYTLAAISILCLFNFKLSRVFALLVFILLGFGLSAAQILPGYELLKLSQRETEPITAEWAFLSYKQIITFIAPDYFGNHATGNFWGPKNYTSHIGFVGVVAVSLSVIALRLFKKSKEVGFLVVIGLVALIFSFANPLSIYIWQKNIFGLEAGASYRILVLWSFAASALAGIGFDQLRHRSKIKFVSLSLILITLLFFALYALTFPTAKVALRNLILPACILIGVLISFRIAPKLLLLLLIIELFYFGWKFTPFPPKETVFPSTEITNYLSNLEKPFRVYGGDIMNVNFGMVYGLEFGSGYDALYPGRMAKFLGVLNSGSPEASAQDRYGIIGNIGSKFFNLINIKYLLAKDGVAENKKALPRAFMVYNWNITRQDKEILLELLDPAFPISSKIILEEDPEIPKSKITIRPKVKYRLYDGDESILEIESSEDGMLFVSDTFYPGWKAYVDGVETKIYRADYVFRAVAVPKGGHEVKFKYEPESFFNGLKISAVSAGLLTVIFLFRKTILGLTHE